MENLGRRNRSREYAIIAASVVCGSKHVDGVVRNLTSGGAMFECNQQFTTGDKVSLDIAGLGRIASSVAWSVGTRSGLRFDEPCLFS
jgi:hypothetical protein